MRPIILGVVGDSAAGKTTLTRGLVRVLGEENVTHVCTDDYHRYDRKQRAERNLTPLHPDCNYIDVMAQHLAHLRAGEPILKPVYQHHDGSFGPPTYVEPAPLQRRRGAARVPHRGDAAGLRRARVPQPAGGSAPAVEGAARLLAPRLHDRPGAHGARPPRGRLRSASSGRSEQYADIVVSLHPGRQRRPGAPRRGADAAATRPPAPGPERRRRREATGSRSPSAGGDTELCVPGRSSRGARPTIEEAIWEKMHFASHLRSERLGEFTIGTDLHRSRLARGRPAPDPLPPDHREGERRPGRRRDTRAR